jgi:broad specificity phosphatase PhoE
MTEIYLVRHGQTEWNAQLIFRGRKDIPLNEVGHKQARALAGALKDRNIDAIYTSPLRRALETAQPVATLFDLEAVPVQGLIDINYGEWEGVSHDEIKRRYTHQYAQWEKRPELVQFPQGETLDAVKERAFGALTDIARKNPARSVLIISHRVINKVLLCALLGISNAHFWEIRQDTGCINIMDYSRDRFVLCAMNDTCHLKELTHETAQPDF